MAVAFTDSEYQTDTLISKCGFLDFLVPIRGIDFDVCMFVNYTLPLLGQTVCLTLFVFLGCVCCLFCSSLFCSLNHLALEEVSFDQFRHFMFYLSAGMALRFLLVGDM